MTSAPSAQSAPPTSEAARACRSGDAILAATLEVLAERGMEGLTVDGVAARAKVGKATIYRHWRSRAELVMDAMTSLPTSTPLVPTGDLRSDLCAAFAGLQEVLGDPDRSRLLAALVDAAERDPELAQLHIRHGAGRRAPARALIAAAVRRGELAPDTDPDLTVDLVAGTLIYRRLLRHEPVSPEVVATVVDAVLAGLRPG